MKIIIVSILAILIFASCTTTKNIQSQQNQKNLPDSVRTTAIEMQLTQYGKQNLLSDQIMIVQIGLVAIGTVAGVQALPLLVVTTACNLVGVLLSKKADKKLSKYNSNENSYK